MNNETVNAVRTIAERMIVESRTDEHTCMNEETYCAGCQKMRDALQLLELMTEPEGAAEEHMGDCVCSDCIIYERARVNEYVPSSHYGAEALYYEELAEEVKAGVFY